MRHGTWYRRLNRSTDHRQSLLRNLVSSLIQHEQIKTTVAKAKTVQPLADKMITLAKRNTTHAFNQARGFLYGRQELVEKLKIIASRFQDRAGGYTRVTRAGFRKGDAAPVAVLEYINGQNDTRFQHYLKIEATSPVTPPTRTDPLRVRNEKLKFAKRLAKLKAGQGVRDEVEWLRLLEKERQRLNG